MTTSKQDQWAQWLLKKRYGGNPEQKKAMLQGLFRVRDKVLQHAQLEPGATLLDVGCGDGLIAFGALEQVGESGKVIFSDISQDLLDHCHELAQEMGVMDRCQFVYASADNLSAFPEHSVDAVITRSVLIYVREKQRAFQEFYRVLKPRGRLSIFEPINSFAYPEPSHIFYGYDVTPIVALKQKLIVAYQRFQPLGDPMLDFNERDLVIFAEKAGFKEIHLELLIDIAPEKVDRDADKGKRWETFLKSSPNPLVPTMEEIVQEALTPEEAEQFASYLRPLVEQGRSVGRMALAYLYAVK